MVLVLAAALASFTLTLAALPFDANRGVSYVKGAILRKSLPLKSVPVRATERLEPYKLCYVISLQNTIDKHDCSSNLDGRMAYEVLYGRVSREEGILFPMRKLTYEHIVILNKNTDSPAVLSDSLLLSMRHRYLEDMCNISPQYVSIKLRLLNQDVKLWSIVWKGVVLNICTLVWLLICLYLTVRCYRN
jgi:hypothetical protein